MFVILFGGRKEIHATNFYTVISFALLDSNFDQNAVFTMVNFNSIDNTLNTVHNVLLCSKMLRHIPDSTIKVIQGLQTILSQM